MSEEDASSTAVPKRLIAGTIGILLLSAGSSACQSVPAPTPTLFPPTPQPQAPAQSTTGQSLPASTDTPTEPTLAPPTPTSPVPTPTAPLTPTASATPVPDPTLYLVQPGDTLLGIAEQFGVDLDALAYANGFDSPEEVSVIAGTELQIPLCEAHKVILGNTLAGISQMCGITLDDLVTTNIAALAPLGSFDAVPVGFVLIFPPQTLTPTDLDCTVQPARAQVIEYTPRPGEGLYCLSQKFAVSTTSILQGNIHRLTGDNVYGERPLLIPPSNGAIYIVSAEDVASGVAVADLAEWYDVELEAITDWNGNPISDPLFEGQQLFVVGANLLSGVFQFQPEQSDAPVDESS